MHGIMHGMQSGSMHRYSGVDRYSHMNVRTLHAHAWLEPKIFHIYIYIDMKLV
jgi:hypothetical protein